MNDETPGLAPDASTVLDVDLLPEPTRDRWEPLRLGLVNLYHFDVEELRFHGGGLLLRGNNGTGKSRILALTLPFLLDGELAPHRVEPDGDPAKRMEWNLLLGRHDERLGWSWIEFGRRTADGPVYTTIACGLDARKGRGVVSRLYVVTDRRVGKDMPLVGDAGQPRSFSSVKELLGGEADLNDMATAHRAAVDRRLFGLGRHRYEALLDLLLALRRPQLSRQLDEAVLSSVLSESLPPLPNALLGDVAEAYRNLEQDRDDLAGFQEASAATGEFLADYHRYAAMATRRRALSVTRAHSAYEAVQDRRRTAVNERHEAEEAQTGLVTAIASAREEVARIDAVVRTLESSPELRDANALSRARDEVDELTGRLRGADDDLERARSVLTDLVARSDTADAAVTAATEHVETTRTATATAVGEAAIRRLVPPPPTAPAVVADWVAATRRQAADDVARQHEAVQVLRGLAATVAAAAAALATARSVQARASSEVTAAETAVVDAATRREELVTEAVAEYRGWAAGVVEAVPVPADDVAFELEGWGDGGRTSPLAEAVARTVDAGRRRLADAYADLAVRRTALVAARAEVAAERDDVADATQVEPPRPPTRTDDRTGRDGAPLWRLLQPRDDTGDAALAGYEAALAGAGLLDAWVTLDGRVLDVTDDAVLLATGASDGPAASGATTLATVLTAEVDQGVPVAVVDRVLAAVGVGEDEGEGPGEVWVAADGRYRLGPLHGRHTPAAQPAFLGSAARAAARERRLAELDRTLAGLDRDLASLEGRARDLDRREAVLDDESARAPSDAGIRQAVATQASARAALGTARDRSAAADREVTARLTAHDDAVARRRETATDLGLADHLEGLDDLADAVGRYRVAVTELVAAVEAWATARRRLDEQRHDRDRAATDVTARGAARAEVAQALTSATARRNTLAEAVGDSADEVFAKLAAARTSATAAVASRDGLLDDRSAVDQRVGAAQGTVRELDAQLAREDELRRQAISSFDAVVRTGFLTLVTDVEADDVTVSADRAVRTCRRVNEQLAGVADDDEVWNRAQSGINGRYTDLEHALLVHALRPGADLVDGLFVVTVEAAGSVRGVDELAAWLDSEVRERSQLLTEKEKEVLETHLAGEIAAELHHLLRAGVEWVAGVNAELDEMPTSTGMRLRFVWRPDAEGPPGLVPARERLLAHHAGWSPAERSELGAFLQQRIAEVRDADDAGTWQEHLATALDYRQWHTFVIERHQDGAWQRLTRRTHGTGSGGEKALALTVPQFAAAAAHYRSATEPAPRMVLLDEAFVGIDADMRAKCLGLLAQFDLDVVMTSEREWGCYPTVPGLAIAQLATMPGVDAVGVTRWVWDGATLTEAPDPAAPVP